jgi:hypothetical protein
VETNCVVTEMSLFILYGREMLLTQYLWICKDKFSQAVILLTRMWEVPRCNLSCSLGLRVYTSYLRRLTCSAFLNRRIQDGTLKLATTTSQLVHNFGESNRIYH